MTKYAFKKLKERADNGNMEAIFEYALEAKSSDEKKKYLKNAADLGHIPAMYAYSRETNDPDEWRHYLILHARHISKCNEDFRRLKKGKPLIIFLQLISLFPKIISKIHKHV